MDTDELAARIRDAVSDQSHITERRMFGGVCFMKRGHMIAGASGTGSLMLRVGKPGYEAAMAHPDTRPMDFTGRVMTGYVYIDPEALEEDGALEDWLGKALEFVATLPAKKA